MWINAAERKPDNSRKVLTRTSEKYISISRWQEKEGRWGSSNNIQYWMDLDNLLSLPIEGQQAETIKIDVPAPKFKVGQRVETITGSRRTGKVTRIHGSPHIEDTGEGLRCYNWSHAFKYLYTVLDDNPNWGMDMKYDFEIQEIK